MTTPVSYTCSLINKAISAVESVEDENFDIKYVCGLLEDIRNANAALRSNWEEEESARENEEARVAELEREIDDLNDTIQDLRNELSGMKVADSYQAENRRLDSENERLRSGGW